MSADVAPTVLSLCSGYAGLELAVRAVYPDSRVVGYVEWEAFSAAVLLARMEDASLEPAPVWCGDLAELPAAPFLGVDLVTAGFPCQPWSAAGRGRGTDDERWIWPDIAALLRRVRPGAVYLENVPPLIPRGGLGLVLADLAALGFDAEWTVLRASDVGAPHIENGSSSWPTPVAHDDQKSPEAHLAMKASMPGGPRSTVTSLTVAAKMWPTATATDSCSSGGNPDTTGTHGTTLTDAGGAELVDTDEQGRQGRIDAPGRTGRESLPQQIRSRQDPTTETPGSRPARCSTLAL